MKDLQIIESTVVIICHIKLTLTDEDFMIETFAFNSFCFIYVI